MNALSKEELMKVQRELIDSPHLERWIRESLAEIREKNDLIDDEKDYRRNQGSARTLKTLLSKIPKETI